MDIEVVRYKDVCPTAYRSFIEECPAATLFHSPDWLQIYELSSSQTKQFLICARESDSIIAAMPVTQFQRLGLRAVFSSGFSAYGGPIARPETDLSVRDRILDAFTSRFLDARTVLARVHDLGNASGRLRYYRFRYTPSTTHLLQLPRTVGDLDRLWGKPSRYRYAVRRIAKAGIRVEASRSRPDLEAWHKILGEYYAAQGLRACPRELCLTISRCLSEGSTLRFFAAKKDDSVVGGLVCVFALRRAFAWMGAFLPEYRGFGVFDALFDAAVREAIEEACDYFDMGPSPSDREGIARFKQQWGGVPTALSVYSYSNTIGRIGIALARYRSLSRLCSAVLGIGRSRRTSTQQDHDP